MKITHTHMRPTPMAAMALAALMGAGSCGDKAEEKTAPPAPRREPAETGAPGKEISPQKSPGSAQVSREIKALAAHDWRMRKEAAEKLADMGEDAREAVPDLIKALSDRDEEVRQAASKALGSVGKPAVLPVIELIERALGKEVFDKRIAPDVSEEEWGKILLALLALKAIGADARNAADTLLRIMKFGCKDPMETPSCYKARGMASDALGNLGQVALPVLMKALAVGDADARSDAARTIGKMGKGAGDAVAALKQMLYSEQASMCEAAAEALGGIGEPAVPTLVEALHEQWPRIREPAARALIKMGPAARVAVPELTKLQNDPKKWTSRAAEDILDRIQ